MLLLAVLRSLSRSLIELDCSQFVLYIGISIAQNITVKTKHIAFKCNFSNKKERRLHLFSSRSFDPSDNEGGDDKKVQYAPAKTK